MNLKLQGRPLRVSAIFLLLLATIAHIFFFTRFWPYSPVFSKLITCVETPTLLTSCLLGFVAGTTLSTLIFVSKRGRKGQIIYVLIAVAAAGLALTQLPFSKEIRMDASYSIFAGFIAALGMEWLLGTRTKAAEVSYSPSKCAQIPAIVFFLITLNFFLALAPLSDMVPAGIQENASWSLSSLRLDEKDSVGIKDNLIFVTIRAALSPLIGHSILINSLVSMTVCAFGIGCLAAALQVLTNSTIALLALIWIMTEGWVLTTAFSANLTVTLIGNAGLLFYMLATALSNDQDAPFKGAWRFAGLSLLSCLASLYSYAAVRIPWVLSTSVLTSILFIRTNGSLLTRSKVTLAQIFIPIMIGILTVCAVGYSFDIQALQKDLFVSWAKTSVRSNPGPAGLKDFALVHNPDTPIWKQVARPINGDNISLIWTRSLSETIKAFIDHLVHVVREHPRYFFLQPTVFLLAVVALIRLPLTDRLMQTAVIASFVWAIIWISSFFSVPDPVAYRRGIAFSAIAPILAAFAFTHQRLPRGRKMTLVTCLGAACAIVRFPDQFRLSNDPETRSRMFTVCANSFPVRTLLTSVASSHLPATSTRVILFGMDNQREQNCLLNAVGSNEWQRALPKSSTISWSGEQEIAGAMKLSDSEVFILYCSVESMRQPAIAILCKEPSPNIQILAKIPVSYGGVSGMWIAFRNHAT